MKICMLVPSLGSGGAERTVSYLCDYAVRNGHQVDVVSLTDIKFYDLPENVPFIPLSNAKIEKNFLKRIIRASDRCKKFKKYVKENKPDVIFGVLYVALYCAIISAKNVPLIGSERAAPEMITSKVKIKIRDYFFKHCDGMIFQTQAVKDYYKKHNKLDGIVIPNAVGNKIAYEYTEPCQQREKEIVAVGRLEPQKDYKTMLDAFEKVYLKHNDFKLIIFGEGKQKQELIQYANSLSCKDNVFFMGAQKDALRRVYSATCYVMTSQNEGMPNALMEAMAVGTPVVSTDCNYGPSELIENNENGQLVPVGDVDAVADAILKYIENSEYSQMCATNAMKLKETNSIDEISRRYLEYFESVKNNQNKQK